MRVLSEVQRCMNKYDATLYDEMIPVYLSDKLKRVSNRTQMRMLDKLFGCPTGPNGETEEVWLDHFEADVIQPLARS